MDDTTRQEKERAIWDRMADSYDARTLAKFRRAYELSISKTCAALSPNDRVLEIGCGTGIMARGVAACVARVVATDISPEMIAAARREAQEASVKNVDFAVQDGYDLPYADGSYDGVLIFNVLHFVKEPRQLLREARRLLAPGGQLLSATDCYGEPAPLGTRLMLGLQRVLKWVGVIPYAHYYRREELQRLFAEQGFAIVEAEDLWQNPVNHYVHARKL